MVVTCIIEFDNNPYGTYYAGQVMSGKITLQSDKVKQVKGILLKIRGFARTSWTERESTTVSDGKSTRTETTSRTFSGHEDYIASLTYLMGSEQNQTSLIEPGIHTFNFACHLRHTCPSSFEGVHGHIRYTVKVALIRPWKFDQTFTKGFTVLKVMDLNYDSPLLRVPCQSEAQKIFCCGPCETQPLIIHVDLPQAGYVPGQTIPVGVLVTNDSDVRVEEMKVELTMNVCYYSQTPYTKTRNQRIVVAKIKGDSVAVYSKKSFQYPLLVPATPPTCFNLCRILQIAYQVEVTTKVKGWHADQVVRIPVTIGNVPLVGVIQQQPTAQPGFRPAVVYEPQTEVASADVQRAQGKATEATASATMSTVEAASTSAATVANVNGYAAPTVPSPFLNGVDIPPPSYEAATHIPIAKINADEAHDYGESEFAPRYPVFNVSSPTAPGVDEVDYHTDVQSNSATQASKGTWL